MVMLRKAWDSIPDQTFTDRFRKAGISKKAAEIAINDDDDPFSGLDIEEHLMENFEEFVDTDLDVCINNKLSDEDILGEISGYQEKSDGEIDANDVDDANDVEDANDEIVKPSWNETRDAINILEDYSLFSNFRVDPRNALTGIDRIVELVKSKLQLPISFY